MLLKAAAMATTFIQMLPAADEEDAPPENPYKGWIGKPDPSWLDSMKTSIKGLSGMFLGAAIVGLIAMFILGAVVIGFAGKSKDNKSAGVRIIANVGIALGAIVAGIPILIILIGVWLRFWQ